MDDNRFLPDDFIVEPLGLRVHRIEQYENSLVFVTSRENILDYLQNLRAKKLPADNNSR